MAQPEKPVITLEVDCWHGMHGWHDRHKKDKYSEKRRRLACKAKQVTVGDNSTRTSKKRKKVRKKFDSTLGYPGEGPVHDCEHGRECLIAGHYHRHKKPLTGYKKREAEKRGGKKTTEVTRAKKCKNLRPLECEPDGHHHCASQCLQSKETFDLIVDESKESETRGQFNYLGKIPVPTFVDYGAYNESDYEAFNNDDVFEMDDNEEEKFFDDQSQTMKIEKHPITQTSRSAWLNELPTGDPICFNQTIDEHLRTSTKDAWIIDLPRPPSEGTFIDLPIPNVADFILATQTPLPPLTPEDYEFEDTRISRYPKLMHIKRSYTMKETIYSTLTGRTPTRFNELTVHTCENRAEATSLVDPNTKEVYLFVGGDPIRPQTVLGRFKKSMYRGYRTICFLNEEDVVMKGNSDDGVTLTEFMEVEDAHVGKIFGLTEGTANADVSYFRGFYPSCYKGLVYIDAVQSLLNEKDLSVRTVITKDGQILQSISAAVTYFYQILADKPEYRHLKDNRQIALNTQIHVINQLVFTGLRLYETTPSTSVKPDFRFAVRSLRSGRANR